MPRQSAPERTASTARRSCATISRESTCTVCEVATDQPLQVRAEPRGRAELHAVGHLVDRDPQAEVAPGQLEPPLDLDQVGADEVQEPVVVGRQERVVLAEHLARDVAEQRADLRPERLAAQIRPRSTLGENPLGQRFEQALEASGVRVHPLATGHEPGASAEAAAREAGELLDQRLGVGHDLRQVLAHPGAFDRRGGRAAPPDPPPGLADGSPVDERGGARTHGPVDGGLHGRSGPSPRPSCGLRSSPRAGPGPRRRGGRCLSRAARPGRDRTSPGRGSRPRARRPERRRVLVRPREGPRLPRPVRGGRGRRGGRCGGGGAGAGAAAGADAATGAGAATGGAATATAPAATAGAITGGCTTIGVPTTLTGRRTS